MLIDSINKLDSKSDNKKQKNAGLGCYLVRKRLNGEWEAPVVWVN